MTYCDVAVVGGGPAGIAAAVNLLGTGLSTVVIAPQIGGRLNYQFQLRNQKPVDTVWGAELVRQFETIVNSEIDTLQHEVTQIEKEEEHFFLTLTGGDRMRARAVIVATGARPQRLYVPGEAELSGHGVSYSAISHASFFRGLRCAVVGYGERALVAGLGLGEIAEQVYFVPTVAFDPNDVRAQQVQNHPKIEVMNGKELIRIKGEEFVESIQLLAPDRSITNLDVEGVFIEMGLLRNNSMVRELLPVNPQTGAIHIDQRCITAVPGCFAAGDITNIYTEQVPVALGEGLKAAVSAWRYLVVSSTQSEQQGAAKPALMSETA